MEVLGVVRLLAEAGVVIGQETRQQLVSGGDGADTLKTKLPRLRGGRLLTRRSCKVLLARSTRPFACGVLAHRMSMLSACKERPNWGMPSPWTAPARLSRKPPCLSCKTRSACHAPRDTRGSPGSSRRLIPSRQTAGASGGWWRRRHRRARWIAGRGPQTTNARSRRSARVHPDNRAAREVDGRALAGLSAEPKGRRRSSIAATSRPRDPGQ